MRQAARPDGDLSLTEAHKTTALLLVDGLYLVESRIGTLDSCGTVFMLAAPFALHGCLTSPPDRVRGPLLRVSVFLGLALATTCGSLWP